MWLAECPFCGSFDTNADVEGCTRCSFEARVWQARHTYPTTTSVLEFLEERGAVIRQARAFSEAR